MKSNVADEYGDYIPTIGIECHVQLNTNTKLFSGAASDARSDEANSSVSPICLGLPGTLPVLNGAAVALAVKAGLALSSEISLKSRFDRKHYFYPDLPKGYQITQLHKPIIGHGMVQVPVGNGNTIPIRIHHAHLEEDAGKLIHPEGASYSLVDLNRAGTPLIEIVSEPDIHSAKDAKAFAEELYLLMTYAGVTQGDLYHGNMRFDVNVSVAKKDAKQLGTRVEVKNLNSFRSVEKVIEFEIKRHISEFKNGKIITQETRGWDDAKQKTIPQRSKEEAQDYRYMPEPDIPPIIVSKDFVESVKETMPKLPNDYRMAWIDAELSESVTSKLLANRMTAQLIDEILNRCDAQTARRVALWFAGMSMVGGNETSQLTGKNSDRQLYADHYIQLSQMVEQNELSSSAAKTVFSELLNSDDTPKDIANRLNLIQISDDQEIIAIVEKVLADPAAAKAINDIKSGNEKAIGFIVGQVMKESKGKANPASVQRLVKERL